jgi:FkbM family methyltransferase
MMVRFPSKTNTLRFLREAEVPAKTIIDVGAHEETIELRQAFPNLRHILFEPASEFHDALRTNYAGMDYVLVPAALSDQEGTGYLEKRAILSDKVTHAIMVDGTGEGPFDKVPTMRLDSFMNNRDEPKPYLLKLDVDGYEMPIMRGSEGIWDDVSCVVVEVTVPSFAERMNFILSKGFRLFDIVDQCYKNDMFWQADLVFVAEKFMQNPILRRCETEKFSWEQWVQIASFEEAVQKSATRSDPARSFLERLKTMIHHLKEHRFS